MSHFLVNGVERSLPFAEERPFSDLLAYVQKTLNNDGSLVSKIRVNGHDVSETEETTLAGAPISSIGSVEIVTVHPRELADETLQTLVPFTAHLEKLSQEAAKGVGRADPSSSLTRLVDGLVTFSDAITSVKDILGIGTHGPEVEATKELEPRLLEKLRELLSCQQTRSHGRMKELLAFELPAQLAAWREIGIPALIRSRDS